MRRSLSTVCLSLLLAVFPLFSEIRETAHFDEVLNHLTPKTLLICDIDDTLLLPAQSLGSDIWLQHRVQELKKENLTATFAFETALREWEALRHLSKVKIVEKGSENILNELQAQGFLVMGLTTQGLALATRTSRQLLQLGIDLSKTAPGDNRDIFFTNEGTGGDYGHGVLYRHGILFTSGTSKGKSLAKLLAQLSYLPEKIVFINDKQSHLEDLGNTVEAMGIAFMGLRYSHEDARIASYNHELATIQFIHSNFAHILSDEEAALLLEEQHAQAL